ncbi:ABC transporter substrate-binding protein [Fusobacterium simiae]|uniref:ABC transporter substrate-binding protein n=1 Tax=Fusobacterium simiae TaxID=855 RepID=A0ABT4DME8_FUSSI|nr:ABC transporter substrate-binding protein [Fusobacterium simiae]MCY7008464.1 ABC transporter substrate-binding protein [Fusobacterium simiae]
MKKLLIFLILLFSFTTIVNAKEVQAKKYNHIVSLTLGGDEMLLGLVSENRIAGLSGKINEDREISNIVDKAKKFPKVESNEEILMSLEPDLIIVADWVTKKIDNIGAIIGAKVYYYKTPSSYEEQKKVIRDLANLVEEKENGEKIIKNMDDRLKILQNKIAKSYEGAKPRILMYTSFGTTSGKNTTFNDMVRLINGVNVAAEAGVDRFKDISKEKIIELNPDIIIVPIARKYDNIDKLSKFLFEDPSFKNVKAIKNKKVYFIQYKNITPISQYMIDGIEELAKVVYQLKE